MAPEHIPWLAGMAMLLIGCGFFSASEAALFLLPPQDLRSFAKGNRAQRTVADLLRVPERLLTAVLFWNLVTNIGYFALASMVALRLQQAQRPLAASVVAAVAFFVFTFFGEIMPKSLGVLRPRALSTFFAIPLAVMVRLTDPLMPPMRLAVLLSQRVFWPRFTPERYLEISDLERAIELSTSEAALLEQEKTVLQNIVSLSDIRVDELMRPRMRLRTFRVPLAISDLEGRVPEGGYALLTESDQDEIAGAVPLGQLPFIPRQHLENYAEEVLYVPWCATAGDTLELLRARDRSVAAVVNELGEIIGVVTLDDILDTVFRREASRSQRLLKENPITAIGDGVWRITGMTTLRRLERQFGVELPRTRAVTVSGVIQEALERMPVPGDRCRWGPFSLEVISAPVHGQLVARLTLVAPPAEED